MAVAVHNITLFQSTPPVWAETYTLEGYDTVDKFQSTPPVWAETAKETIFSSLKHLYYNIFYRKKQENSMQILSFGIFIPIFPFDFGANLPIC